MYRLDYMCSLCAGEVRGILGIDRTMNRSYCTIGARPKDMVGIKYLVFLFVSVFVSPC